MENKNWQLASTFIFFLNIRKWKMKMYVQFFFFFQKCENLCSIFIFFSGHRKMKKTKQNKKKKRKCVSTFNFFRKMKNNKSVVNFQFSMKTNSTHNVFLLFFVLCSVPRSSLAGTKQDGHNRESPWQRGWKGLMRDTGLIKCF